MTAVAGLRWFSDWFVYPMVATSLAAAAAAYNGEVASYYVAGVLVQVVLGQNAQISYSVRGAYPIWWT